jgi:hypothetical protein
MFTLPQQLPKQDLLENWFQRVELQNSQFARKRSIIIGNQSLANLRDYFTSFFGADFFRFDASEIKTIQLKIKGSDWFLQQLSNDDYPSLVHLYEIVRLLESSKQHHPALFKVLQSNTGNQSFRNYLFEAVIYEMLLLNKVPYEAKTTVNGKEKEGFMWLGETKFLFECKKLYSYQLPGIDFIFSIQQEFFKLWQKNPFSLNGYISVIRNTEPAFKKNKSLFTQAFREYIQHVRNSHDVNLKKIIANDQGDRIGELFFEPHNEAIFRHQVPLIKGPAVCFRVNPPRRGVVNDKVWDIHNTEFRFRFEMLDSVSMDFLIAQIGKKRKSQNDLRDMPRIFFFDNEIYRGPELPLFSSGDRFDGKDIQQYLDSKQTDDIICIVFREYGYSRLPHWTFKAYCKPSLNKYKTIIEGWSSLYQEPHFLSQLPRQLS